MIVIKNVRTIDGNIIQFSVENHGEQIFDAEGKLTLFPARIDPHFILNKDWKENAHSAILGGVTTLFSKIESNSSTMDSNALTTQKDQINIELENAGLMIHHYFYLDSNKDFIEEIISIKDVIQGIKLEMDAFNENELDHLFRIAAQTDLMIVVDSENSNENDHSKISAKMMKKAIAEAEKYNGQLFFLNISTEEEIEIIRKMKHQGIMVYAETTPYHLYHQNDKQFLWDAIEDGSIDAIGSNIEILFPFLLNAYHEKKISLEKIVETTRKNVQMMFGLPQNEDLVLVDLAKEAKHTQFEGQKFRGWPTHTILNGQIFPI